MQKPARTLDPLFTIAANPPTHTLQLVTVAVAVAVCRRQSVRQRSGLENRRQKGCPMPEENGRFSARESEFFEFHSSSILVPRDHDALSLRNIRLGAFDSSLSLPLSLDPIVPAPSSPQTTPYPTLLSLSRPRPPPLCFGSGSSVLSLSTALTGIRESPWFTVTGIWKCS